jgi:hypothetical protein
MMKRIQIISLATLLLAVSCVNEKQLVQEDVKMQASLLTTKSVNTSVDALPGSLLVKFYPQAAEKLSQGYCVEEVDMLCEEFSASCKNLFPLDWWNFE